MSPIKSLLAVTTALALTGCSLGPDFERPPVSAPSQLADDQSRVTENAKSVLTAETAPADWWTIFNDPELSKLETEAMSANLDLKIASARFSQSRAQRTVAGAAQYPSIDGNASYAREKASANGPDSVNQRPADLFQYGFDASWEIDLWGKVRRSVEAADANLQAQKEAERDALVSVLAEVARDYIELRGVQETLAITERNLTTARDILRVTRERYSGGLATDLDVANAGAQVTHTEAQLPPLREQESETINSLSLLLGQEPGALRAELGAAHPIPPVPPKVPMGLPSELARRRPDIRQAEAMLHSATAQIGLAKADFYPSITLSGSAGLQGMQFGNMGSWNSLDYGFGPSMTLPIFEGGRLEGTLELREAQQREAAVTYQKTVLQAWHEIDDAMTAYGAEQIRHERLVATVEQDRRALDLARIRYTKGLENFLSVLDAERNLLSAEQDLTGSSTAISTRLVTLYKALGGGWENNYPVGQSEAKAG